MISLLLCDHQNTEIFPVMLFNFYSQANGFPLHRKDGLFSQIYTCVRLPGD